MAKISRMNDLKNKLSRSGEIIFNGNETGKILIKDRKLNIILETQDNELLKYLRGNAIGILKVKGENYEWKYRWFILWRRWAVWHVW